jgi:uncharacterized protein YuzE
VSEYGFTRYFESQVARKRPYLTKEICIQVVRSPIRVEAQGNERYRFWGRVDELGGRFLHHTQRIFGSEVPAMKLNYYPETDSLYIDFSSRPSAESQEVSEGVVLDYDAEGNLVGIDIDQASRKLDLRELVTSHIPLGAGA